MRNLILMSWSGGKDSALALREVLADARYEVVALVTTVTAGFDRIAMHGVRRSLLEAQAAALGLHLRQVPIPPAASNAVYEERMKAALKEFGSNSTPREGAHGTTSMGSARFPCLPNPAPIRRIAFGDLFLADIRAYRARLMRSIGMEAVYPVWGRDTARLAHAFIAAGFRARLVCIDPRRLDRSFAGREFDAQLLADLPPGVDPCGENGEFHTFVYDGPIFRHPVPVKSGEIVERDGFIFADLLPAEP